MMEGGGEHRLRLGEFVALVALLFSLVALSIDAMLPALPVIGTDLGVEDPNDPQLIIAALLFGLAFGQLLSGPLSDSLGRKPVIYAGLVIFMLGCLLSQFAPSFEWMLAGRVLQGAGAAGPRVVTVALVRDQYEGPAMARVMSFALSVFILVPAIAPAIGQGILLLAGWRAIFGTFFAIALVGLVWFGLRQPETLPLERRNSISVVRIARAAREVCTTRVAIGYTIATGLVFACLVAYLSSAQQIFQETYGVGEWFPAYFAVLALAIGCATLVNGRLVVRHGMRRLSNLGSYGLTAISLALMIFTWAAEGLPALSLLMAHLLPAFFCLGLLFGNLNALSMAPLGHIAGVGAAVVAFVGTLISVPLGAAVGQAYGGTVTPMVAGFLVFGAAAILAMRWAQAEERSLQ